MVSCNRSQLTTIVQVLSSLDLIMALFISLVTLLFPQPTLRQHKGTFKKISKVILLFYPNSLISSNFGQSYGSSNRIYVGFFCWFPPLSSLSSGTIAVLYINSSPLKYLLSSLLCFIFIFNMHHHIIYFMIYFFYLLEFRSTGKGIFVSFVHCNITIFCNIIDDKCFSND